MATVAELIVKIGANSAGLRKELEKTQRQIKRSFGSEAMEASRAAAVGIAGFAAATVAAGIASVKMAADMQAQRKSFTTLLKSADAADAMLRDMVQFAKDTPFDLQGVTDAAKRMLAFKFEAQDVIPILATVGDAAAMLGKGTEGIDRITLAIAQMQAKGKVSAEEMGQLAEQGIGAWAYLADALGVSTAEAMKMAEQGMIDGRTGINAILKGMQADFRGGMKGLSDEIPGLAARIQESFAQIARHAGESIIETTGLKNVMSQLAKATDDFANAVERVGFNRAFKDFFSAQTTQAVFMLAGAISGAAVGAFVLLGIAMGASLLILAKFIAIGAVVGAIVWSIWKAWEPLGEMFHQLGELISNALSTAFNFIAAVANDAASWILKAFEPVVRIFDKELADSLKNWSVMAEENAKKYYEATDNAAIRTKAAAGAMSYAWDEAGNTLVSSAKEMTASVSSLSTEFKGLSGNATQAAKITAKEMKKITDLQKTARGLGESARSLEIEVNFTGVDRELAQLKADSAAAVDEIKQKYREASDEYVSLKSNYEKTAFIQALKDQGIAFKIAQTGELDFAEQIAKEKLMTEQKLQQDIKELRVNSTRYWEKLDKAYESGNVANYIQAINDKQSADEQWLKGQQELMDVYTSAWEEATRTAASRMAEIMKGITSSFQTFFSSSLGGTASLSEAFSTLGQNIRQVFADMVANWITSQITMAMFGKMTGQGETEKQAAIAAGWVANTVAATTYFTTTTAGHATATATQMQTAALAMTTIQTASLAMAASIAAAWASAAAMVSLATLGGNAAPAQAGIIATVALTQSLAVPALADGGITTGPTLAEIGEGRYKEAVMPLNRRIFERMGLTAGGGGNKTININGDINTVADYRKMLNDIDRRISAGSRSK